MSIRTLATLAIFTLLVSSPALAQTGEGDRPGRSGDTAGQRAPGQGPRGDRPGANRGGRDGNQEMITKRMMRADTDKDGRVSREEATTGNGNGRFFTQADADGDGYVTRVEVIAFVETRMGDRPTGRGGDMQRAPQNSPAAAKPVDPREAFNEAMEVSGRALRSIRRAKFDAISMQNDLKAIRTLQTSLMTAKQYCAAVPMSDAAKAKFGNDEKAYQAAFQIDMIKAMLAALQIEKAALEGNAAGAKAAVKTVVKIRSDSHDLFEN
jgi:soluble cytochrome b562